MGTVFMVPTVLWDVAGLQQGEKTFLLKGWILNILKFMDQ